MMIERRWAVDYNSGEPVTGYSNEEVVEGVYGIVVVIGVTGV